MPPVGRLHDPVDDQLVTNLRSQRGGGPVPVVVRQCRNCRVGHAASVRGAYGFVPACLPVERAGIERALDGLTLSTWPHGPSGLIEQGRLDPPRVVEVEHHEGWWAGFQYAWELCDDHRGWMTDVSWTERYEWGLGASQPMVRPE